MTEADEIEIRSERHGDAMVLTPVGEIDLSRAPALRQRLSDAMTTRPRLLVIDLAEVPYMDSSGVATFVEAMQLSRKEGSRLILCGLQERVRAIFEIARLDMVFTILADTGEALSA